jgi:hypothetical protein
MIGILAAGSGCYRHKGQYGIYGVIPEVGSLMTWVVEPGGRYVVAMSEKMKIRVAVENLR